MNLQSKKARIPIAALGVTALIAGAGALGLASPASAAGAALTLTPSVTDFTTLDSGAQAVAVGGAGGTNYNLAQPLSDATFATHVSSTGMSAFKLSVDSFAAATGVTTAATPYVYYAEQSASSGTSTGPAPVASGGTGAWKRVTAPAVGGTAVTGNLALSSGASPNNVFLTAAVPGTYTVHFLDAGTQPGTDDDSVSPTITITVKDVGGVTTSTTDDYTPSLSVPSNVDVGAPIKATVGLGPVTLADARGSSAGTGILAAKLNAAIGIAFAGTGLVSPQTTYSPGTLGTTSTVRTLPVGTTTAPVTITTNVGFDTDGSGAIATPLASPDTLLVTAASSVNTNNVTTDVLATTDVTGSVKTTNAAGPAVSTAAKTSQASIAYTATVTNTTTATDISGKVVYFTVTGVDRSGATPVGTTAAVSLAKLTTDGTTVDTSSTTSHVYSAVTDTTGVATLTVTSSNPVASDSYTVKALSNNVGPNTVTTLYQTAVASSVKVMSSTADLTVPATSAVTIKGSIYDQFGNPVSPVPSASQQAELFVGALTTTCSPATAPTVTTTTAGLTQNATVTAGNFSFTYTPTATPAAGQCAGFKIGYDADGDGNLAAGETASAQINYASAADAASLSITAPADASAQTLLQHTTNLGTTPLATPVTGAVTDASNATLAYKAVTLTGGDGVYFSTVANPTTTTTTDDLVNSLTVVSNGSGTYTAYAFFTDAGSHKITVTAGTATKSVNVTVNGAQGPPVVATAVDPYKVSVDDVAGAPGDTLIVTGKVLDMFGNPVANNKVGLSTSGSAIGTLGGTSPYTTNSDGVFSTTFTSGSNSSGDVTLTATLYTAGAGGTAFTSATTLVPDATYKANGGLTFDKGAYLAQGKVSITRTILTLSAPAKATASGNGAKFKIHGTFMPTATVDIYSKESGESAYDLAGSKLTDEDGNYSFDVQPKVSTTYLAKSVGLSSGAASVTVFSKVTLTAKAMGSGRVKLTANGDPNAEGALKFYRSVTGTDPKLSGFTSSDKGGGSVIVKLPKGTQKVYVTFQAPGTDLGKSKTVKVKVK